MSVRLPFQSRDSLQLMKFWTMNEYVLCAAAVAKQKEEKGSFIGFAHSARYSEKETTIIPNKNIKFWCFVSIKRCF